MRTALKTLPWVEQTSVRTDVKKREVLFNLKGESGFIEEDVRKALKGQGFPEVAVRAAPAAPDKKR